MLNTVGEGSTDRMKRKKFVEIQSVSVASALTSSEGVKFSGASQLLCRFDDLHKHT